MSMRETTAAAAAFKQAVALQPDFAAGHFNLGNAQLDAGEAEAAVASFERALNLRQDWIEALVNLLGALCCIIGLLISIPVTLAAITIAYQELVGFDPATPDRIL